MATQERNRAFLCPAVLILVYSGLACERPQEHEPGAQALALADFVGHQTENVTTDLISAPEGLGLDRLGHGWRTRTGDGAALSHFVVNGGLGRISLFSATGDLSVLEMELSLGGGTSTERMPVNIQLNGRRLARIKVRREWSSYSLEVPPEQVRQGENLLGVRPRPGPELAAGRRVPSVRLRRVRARPRGKREPWLQRPEAIRVTAETSDPRLPAGVEMPADSYIDMVLNVPKGGSFRGRFTIDRPGSDPRGVSRVWVQLLDERGLEHWLLREEVAKTPSGGRGVELDLGNWAGQLVRLRIGIDGETNALLRWLEAGVHAPGPGTSEPPYRPIDRSVPESSGRLGRPDILVILLDAARSDAFSPYGGPYPTPAVERLADDGTLFETALSTAPWTGQSVASLLTGLYPDTLGFGARGSRLPKEIPTLAELLAPAGYRRVIWSQHPLYRNHPSFKRGFDEVHRGAAGRYDRLPAPELLLAADRPTFAWLHLIPPHAPYRPPEPFLGRYTSWFDGDLDVDAPFLQRISDNRGSPEALSSDELRYVKDRYLENASFADDLVARLLAILDDADRYRDALIVLLSDHGEAFLEHGRFLHGHNLHREMLRVPFIVKWPESVVGHRVLVTDPVSLVDLVPTLVEGLALPSGNPESGAVWGFQGRSLLPAVFEDRTADRPHWAVTRRVLDWLKPADPELMLDLGAWRVLYEPASDRTRIYRGDSDPGETEDLASELPLRTLLLKQSLLMQSAWNRQLLRGKPLSETVDELDPETIEQLKTLGYLN